MNENFANFCKMSQKTLKNTVVNHLRTTHEDITVGDGFVYAQGTFPVLLVAHLDTVHKSLPTYICYDARKGAFYSPAGIGGDDRCGVYMILEIVKKFNCSVLFCEDEESGGIGARKFIQTDLAKELTFNYIIELDRRGSNDAVFYDCDNEDFEKFITEEFYKTSWGTFSDISIIAPFLECAAVNLSCGYYNAHTVEEYVVLTEMEDSIDAVCKLLERTTEDDKFEYVERVYTGKNYRWGNYYGGGYSCANYAYEGEEYEEEGYTVYDNALYYKYTGNIYYIFEYMNVKGLTDWAEVYADNKTEAVGKFLMFHPDTTFNDIISVDYDSNSV